ncbi:hypothetical protein HKX48_000204 [Thoreauomyces humboldtii]|nr:hypothetical protein HKX48_000204 [Thoreauomyces humboldtii]
MNRDDWYLLLVVLSKDDRQQASFMKIAEQLLNDMEESRDASLMAEMFEQWAQHFGIKNLKEAEHFIRMVWWCAAPAIISDELYAVLISVMRKLGDLPGAKALYEQARQAARVGDSIDDVLGSRLIKKCGYDASDVQAAAVIFDWFKRRGVADVLVYAQMMAAVCAVGDLAAAEILLLDPAALPGRLGRGGQTFPVTTSMCNYLVWAYTQRGLHNIHWMQGTGV